MRPKPALSPQNGNKSPVPAVRTIRTDKNTMGSPLDQFDAPELKTAVRRLYAAERAPASLRHRVESILHTPQTSPSSMRIHRAIIWQWAAAAVILVGLTGL